MKSIKNNFSVNSDTQSCSNYPISFSLHIIVTYIFTMSQSSYI